MSDPRHSGADEARVDVPAAPVIATATVARYRRRLTRLRYKSTKPLHDLYWKFATDAMIDQAIERSSMLRGYYWLFVVGVNNSGTTLIHELLRDHPEVRTLPKEGHRLTTALPHPADYRVGRLWTRRMDIFRWTADHDPSAARQVKYDWLFYCPRRPGLILEKSPPNTIRALWLQKHFQPCRFIVMTRDPYAVSEGIHRRMGWTVEESAEHWAESYRCLLDDQPSLTNVLTLRYEDLCDDTANQIERMEQFLQLKLPIDGCVADRPMRARNIDGTRSPLTNFNAKSIDRLSPGDVDAVTRAAGSVMERLGYTPR